MCWALGLLERLQNGTTLARLSKGLNASVHPRVSIPGSRRCRLMGAGSAVKRSVFWRQAYQTVFHVKSRDNDPQSRSFSRCCFKASSDRSARRNEPSQRQCARAIRVGKTARSSVGCLSSGCVRNSGSPIVSGVKPENVAKARYAGEGPAWNAPEGTLYYGVITGSPKSCPGMFPGIIGTRFAGRTACCLIARAACWRVKPETGV